MVQTGSVAAPLGICSAVMASGACLRLSESHHCSVAVPHAKNASTGAGLN